MSKFRQVFTFQSPIIAVAPQNSSPIDRAANYVANSFEARRGF